jgi:DNA-binding winged helix-turn-helix (wHTH) protein/TolB-like protein/Tfp pilus assembly protein PilF
MLSMQTYRFGEFELDLDAQRLRLRDEPVRLERRPLDLLVLLVSRHGRMVTREEIIAALWPAGIIIDFESGLNTLVRKVRNALGDSSDHPTFIETVPGRGYRFVAPVVAVTERESATEQSAELRTTSRLKSRPVAALLFLLLAAGAAIFVWQAGYIKPAQIVDLHREAPSIGRSESETPRVDLSAQTLAVLPLRASAEDEAGILLAQSVTELIRDRLASLEGLTVVASSSTSGLADSHSNVRSLGERLHARFLLKGDTDQTGERLRLDVQLMDAQSDDQVWSAAFDRPLTEVAAIREEISQQIAGVLHIPVDPAASSALVETSISLDAYQLYIRGQQLMANATMTDTERAVELFRRATILDPRFARAYLGLGQALLELDVTTTPFSLGPVRDARNAATPAVRARAAQAFDRALELSPTLGEAWVEHARLARDPVKAEELYRNGLDLAPNYGAGYVHYAGFLFREGRVGEAIETIGRARRIDPLTPELHLLQAFFLLVIRSDVGGHDRLVREALEINPRLPSALQQLARSRWELSGEFADAAQLIERAIAVEPYSPNIRSLARDVYLELGDPVAAAAVLGDSPPAAAMEIAQHEGDRARAAALLKDMPPEDWRDTGAQASMTEAIRDAAIAAGDFEPGVRRLESVYAIRAGEPSMWHRASSLVYAHTLILAGEVERGRRLAESTLALIDTHSVGRAGTLFSRQRAAAFAVLGEDERALDELAISVRDGRLYRWWYLAEHDPLYEHLRRHPRFQALNQQAQQHLDRQRALLEEMRRKGEIPTRSVGAPPPPPAHRQ